MKELHSPEFNPGRSGKDLSHRKVLTAKVGELLPVLCEEVIPKDYFEIDVAALARTFALQTAAFVRSKVCFDFFFVPMTAVWRNYDAFYYQRQDNYSSLRLGSAYEPNIKLLDLAEMILDGADDSDTSDYDSQSARAKLCALLGYSDRSVAEWRQMYSGSSGIADKSLTCLPLMAYQRIYNLWYRNAWRDEPSETDLNDFSADNVTCDSYATSLVDIPGTNRRSLGGFVQTFGLCSMRFHQWPSDIFMGSLPNSQFGNVSSIDNTFAGTTTKNFDSGTDFLRWKSGGSFSGSANVVVYTNSPSLNENSLYSGSADESNRLYHTHQNTLVFNSGEKLGSFDVLALRKAIATQKWKEYNMRAGWKAGKQAKAMFGVEDKLDRKHDIEYIDGFHFPVMIDEVTQTTQVSATSPLGELGGKAIGVGNGSKIKFSSGERHGYLMCIAYVLPEAEYDAVGIDKMLVRSEPTDHYMPAFENLGLEPVQKFELNSKGNPAAFDLTLGYVPRYHEYKSRVDKVYGQFLPNGSLRSWVSQRLDLESIANSGFIPTKYFYVSPAVFRNLFYALPDGSGLTDQFMLNINFDVKAVRAMSDLGLPML